MSLLSLLSFVLRRCCQDHRRLESNGNPSNSTLEIWLKGALSLEIWNLLEFSLKPKPTQPYNWSRMRSKASKWLKPRWPYAIYIGDVKRSNNDSRGKPSVSIYMLLTGSEYVDCSDENLYFAQMINELTTIPDRSTMCVSFTADTVSLRCILLCISNLNGSHNYSRKCLSHFTKILFCYNKVNDFRIK